MESEELEARRLADHGRRLFRDDVEGICQSLDMCFEYGGHVRCGPCAIEQAKRLGVETDYTQSSLPEVCRLTRQLAEKEAENKVLREALEAIRNEAERENGGWIHLRRVIAAQARTALTKEGGRG